MEWLGSVGLVLLGAAIGWVLEWLYDMALWRSRGGKPARDGNSDLEIRLASSEAEAKKLRKELEGIRGKAKSSEFKGGEVKDRDPKEADALKAAQKEIEAMRGKLNVALGEVSQLKARSEGNTDAVGKLGTAQKEMRTLQARMMDLEASSAKLQEAEGEVNRLRGLLDARSAPEETAILKSELFGLQARLKDAEGMRAGFEAQSRELENLRSSLTDTVPLEQHSRLQAELETLHAQSGGVVQNPVETERIQALETQLEYLSAELNRIQSGGNADTLEGRFTGIAPEQHNAVLAELESLRLGLNNRVPLEQHEGVLGELENLRSSFAGMVPLEQHGSVVSELETLRGNVSGMVPAEQHQNLVSELEVLRQRSSELVERTRLDDLERHLLEVQAELEESRMAARAAQGRVQDLEQEATDGRTENEGVQARLNQLEGQLAQGTVLEHELEELRERVVRMVPSEVYGALETELAGVRRQLEARGMDAGEQEARLNTLETELATARPRISELEFQLATLREYAGTLVERPRFEGVQTNLDQARAALAQAQSELEEGRAQLTQTGQQLEALRGQNESLSVQLHEVQTLRVRVQELEGSQAQLGVLEGETEELRRQLSSTVSSEALHQAQGEIRILKDALDVASHQNTLLEEAQSGSKTSEVRFEQVSSELAVAQRDLAHLHTLQDRVADLDRELEETRTHTAQLAEVRQQLGAREAELFRVKSDLEEAQQGGFQLSAAEAELSDLRNQLENRPSQAEIDELRGELEGMLSQLEGRVSSEDLRQVQRELEEAQTQLQAQLQSRVPASDLERAKGELEELRTQMGALNAQVTPLKARAEQAQHLYIQLKATQTELEGLRAGGGAGGEADDLQHKLNASEDERAIMRQRLSEMVDRETVEELEEELEQLRDQSKNTSGQTAQLLNYIEKLQSAETEIRILKNQLEGKPDEQPVQVDTGAFGSAVDDMFGGFMGNDKKG